MPSKGNIYEKLGTFSEHWSPKIIAELNGQDVRVAKLLGEFEWHSHEQEDEMFLILTGQLEIHFRERVERLSKGDFIVIPRGTEHKPVALTEVEVLLFEPSSTVNTGSNQSAKTKTQLDRI